LKKILLFEPWHLGDVAIALSLTKAYHKPNVEFSLVCNNTWKDWTLSTGIIRKVFVFTPPWTKRYKREKYNPFNYRLNEIMQFKKQVMTYKPDYIVNLRGDIRAKLFLKLLFGKTKIISAINEDVNVYNKRDTLKQVLSVSISKTAKVNQPVPKSICLFFGATDFNRTVPLEKSIELVSSLSQTGYGLNLVLQPNDDFQKWSEIKSDLNLESLRLIKGDVLLIANIIKESSIMISTDSGWLHVAHFYEKPVIGLFGFDTVDSWLPPGAAYIKSKQLYPESYRYKNKYQSLQPLASIDVSQVVKSLQQFQKSLFDPIVIE
jgi:ADP-heptose:LPS heptosyltransferase